MAIRVIGGLVLDVGFEVDDWPVQNRSIHARSAWLSAGGKGLNQAVAIRRLGADVGLVGCVGQDFAGGILFAALAQEQLSSDFITRHSSAKTSLVGLIIREAMPGFIGAPDASKRLTEDNIKQALSGIGQGDVVLVNFEIPQNLIAFALQMARLSGATTILNPAPYFMRDEFVAEYLHLVDYLIPNLHEARMLAGRSNAFADTLTKILREKGPKHVCITLGEQGCFFVSDQTSIHQPAIVVDVVDTTGASDAFCGAFVFGLHEGWEIPNILQFASTAAAYACTMIGAMNAMPTRPDVEKLLHQR